MRASTCRTISKQREKYAPITGVRKHYGFLAKYDVLSTLMPKPNIRMNFRNNNNNKSELFYLTHLYPPWVVHNSSWILSSRQLKKFRKMLSLNGKTHS